MPREKSFPARAINFPQFYGAANRPEGIFFYNLYNFYLKLFVPGEKYFP